MRNRNNAKRPGILLLAGVVTSVATVFFVTGCASKSKSAKAEAAPVPLNLPQDSTDQAMDPQYKPTPEVLSTPPRENTVAEATDPVPPPPPKRAEPAPSAPPPPPPAASAPPPTPPPAPTAPAPQPDATPVPPPAPEPVAAAPAPPPPAAVAPVAVAPAAVPPPAPEPVAAAPTPPPAAAVAVAPAAVPPPPPPAPAETLAPPPPAPAPTQTPPPTSAPQESSPHQAALDAGFAALESEQYNEALGKADQALAAAPHGPATAEALYLKGRALEGKNASGQLTADEIKKSLADARVAYIKALDQVPKQPLDSYIRTSLANVAYFQDDYPTAISQWSAAYEKLDRDDVKAWALYRVGVSQQRLGQFTKADQTFASVQQLHPNSVPAQRAHEHQGARAFYVQLATFASQKPAAAAANDLNHQGITTTLANDAQGHTLLRTGAIASYAQAQYFKNRLMSKYPDAVILP